MAHEAVFVFTARWREGVVDFDFILDVAAIGDAVAFATAHGAGREAGCEGQSRAREKGARGGGVSEEVEG